MDIVKITDDALLLSSGLNQNSFAKTNSEKFLSQKNYLIKITSSEISLTPHYFSSTKSDENNMIFYTASPVNGKIFSEYIEKSAEDRTESDLFAILSVFKAIDFLIKENSGSMTGCGGIIVESDFSKKTANVLFINSELFEICAENHKRYYASLQGKYIYKGLDSVSSLLFLRGVLAYRLLTGLFPYDCDDTGKRQEDIFDENFIPIELNKKIDKTLSESINASLCVKQKNEIVAGKRNISDSKSEQKRNNIINKAERFDLKSFETALLQSPESDEKLLQKKTKYLKKQQIQLKIKRFFRKNKNRIIASLSAVFILSWFITGFVKENAKLITTQGLTSEETVHALYTMIHRSDVPNLQEIISGKDTKDLLTKISGYFISAKQRLEASPDYGTVAVAKWFFYNKNSKNWMHGITNLKIDGKTFNIEDSYSRRMDKPNQITTENGKILNNGDEVTHKAEYYFIHQAETKIFIEKMIDSVTLRWNGKKWKVIKVDGKSKVESVKSKDFIEEFYSLSSEETESEKSGIKKALKTLREKYTWIPDKNDFTDAAEFLADEYDSIEARKYLK